MFDYDFNIQQLFFIHTAREVLHVEFPSVKLEHSSLKN